MIEYEVAVLFHPDLEIDLSKATGKVEGFFKEAEGKIIKTDNWGKRKLAYPIDKQDHGIYVFYSLELDPSKLAKLDSQLRIADEVIRYLITKPNLRAIAKAEEERAKKAKHAERQADEQEEKEEE